MSSSDKKDKHVQACREWLARRTAHLDQIEKRNTDLYPVSDATVNLSRMNDLEARRFWVDVHKWELEQQIESGSIDEYPQRTEND